MVRGIPLSVALATACFSWLAICGCASTGPDSRRAPESAQNLIFGPEWVGLATRDVERSDWPATTVFPDVSEQIIYRERLTDLQGRTHGGQDYFYRRFTSIRTGERRR